MMMEREHSTERMRRLKREVVQADVPLPIAADYIQHTCQSYAPNMRHLVFQTESDPALSFPLFQNHLPLPSVLIHVHPNVTDFSRRRSGYLEVSVRRTVHTRSISREAQFLL
jgi:hypothetical protein